MKKLITLCTLLLCAVVTAWADAYDVTADKVIILNDVYDANATGEGYSSHSAIAWEGTASTSSKKAGDPENNGEVTSSDVNCFSVKGNGKGKNITVSVKNCSKIIVYHEKQSSRYIELRNGSKTGDVLGKSVGNTYYTEVALDDAKSYTIFLHGINSSNSDQDFYVYAVKLFAPAAVDPVFSLTATSIGLDETSRIQVGAKGNLDGIALTGLASSDPTVATVDNTGLITPKKIGTTTISFTASAAVDGKYNATSTTFSEELTVTAPVVDTPVISPANGTYFLGDNQSVTIACSTDGAAIQYSTDGGSSWNNYTGAFDISNTTTILVKATKDGYTESAQATATINKLVPAELTAVSEATTWDWTGWKETLELTDATTPNNNTELTYSDIALINPINLPTGFNGDAISFKGQFPVRSGYAQNCTFRIHVMKPGTIKVTFSNTGGSNKDRYVQVTDAFRTQRGLVEADGTGQRNETFKVVGGEVTITGVPGTPGGNSALRFFKIEYSPVEKAGATIPESRFCTYSTNYPVDLSTITGGTAYIATGAADGKVTLTKCEEKVNAATGLLIAGEAGAEFKINTTADATVAPAGNLLVGMPNGGAVPAGKYVFAWPNTDPTAASFYKLNEQTTIDSFKAYLDVPAGDARLSLSFGEDAGETTGISEMKNVKADGTIFNLRGQRVAQPQKGLYILNGKKTIVK